MNGEATIKIFVLNVLLVYLVVKKSEFFLKIVEGNRVRAAG